MPNLPINLAPYYNTDDTANSIAADGMFDCYLEAVPDVGFVTRRRPGLKLFADVGTGRQGDGLVWWSAARKLVAVSKGRVFFVGIDGTCQDVTGDPLKEGTPVVFASGQKLDGSPWLYMANGELVYTTGGNTAKPSDTNTPPATHVCWIDSRFLANIPGTNQFLYTDTNIGTGMIENDFWSSTGNPLTCEIRADNLLSIFSAWQEVYTWGEEGLQVWQDDGSTPFSTVPGAFSEAGLAAEYSPARANNTVFALCVVDGKRCVVALVGRQPTVISEPIARVLSEMSRVSDAIGDIISVGGMSIYLLTFPSENQSWAYDYINKTWSRWGSWNGFDHDRFIGQHSCFAAGFGKHLIQSSVDGKIYELDRNTYDDAGSPMISYRRTGWIDYGNSWVRKRSTSFYIKAKSGGSDTATLLMRWRDDGRQEWSPFMSVELSPTGNYNFIAKLNRFGMFRSRQYEFRPAPGVDVALVGATEDVKVMQS